MGSAMIRLSKAAGQLLWRLSSAKEGCIVFKELFRPPSTPAPAAPRSFTGTVIGSKAKLEGTLVTEGDVRLDGIFTGDITARGNVTIGESGDLKGELIGGVVRVAGLVRGDIVARKVAILKTGRVHGNLIVESLVTEEGGFIQGQIRMEEAVDLSEHFPEPPAEADSSPQAEEPTHDPQQSKTPRAVKLPPTGTTGKTTSQ
jgi:cytoskeletal protein CcmA (bactofilin family)